MAPSLDCAASSLLCAEDNSVIFYDDDDDGCVDNVAMVGFDYGWHHRNHRADDNRNQNFYGEEALSELSVQSEECLAEMVHRECEHLPVSDYLERLKIGELDLVARQEVVDWIIKVHAHFNFGPLCLYFSISYLDRFLSAYELPSKAWMMQLLAVACVSLASKMEETEVPSCLDLQIAESKFIFEGRTIQRMELLVLSTLKWRMQSVTPFSFVHNFLKKIMDTDQISSRPSISRVTQLILGTTKGIDFLEYKPSEVAAAVAIFAAGEIQAVDTEKAISALIQHVEKEKVVKCMELINELSSFGEFMKAPSTTAPSVPQSPIGVLDAACLSYKTDDTATAAAAVGSCANSSHSTPVPKRRRLVDL